MSTRDGRIEKQHRVSVQMLGLASPACGDILARILEDLMVAVETAADITGQPWRYEDAYLKLTYVQPIEAAP